MRPCWHHLLNQKQYFFIVTAVLLWLDQGDVEISFSRFTILSEFLK